MYYLTRAACTHNYSACTRSLPKAIENSNFDAHVQLRIQIFDAHAQLRIQIFDAHAQLRIQIFDEHTQLRIQIFDAHIWNGLHVHVYYMCASRIRIVSCAFEKMFSCWGMAVLTNVPITLST